MSKMMSALIATPCRRHIPDSCASSENRAVNTMRGLQDRGCKDALVAGPSQKLQSNPGSSGSPGRSQGRGGTADGHITALFTVPMSTVANQFAGRAEFGRRPLHAANLQDTLVGTHGIHHDATFKNRVRHRLFAVNILARLNCGDGNQGMPVIWRRDHDGINVFSGEQFAKIIVGDAITFVRLSPLLWHPRSARLRQLISAFSRRVVSTSDTATTRTSLPVDESLHQPLGPCVPNPDEPECNLKTLPSEYFQPPTNRNGESAARRRQALHT